MSSEEVRARLESLFYAIRSTQALSIDCAVPRGFLANNNKRLVSHDFRDAFQLQEPPILFEPFKDLKRNPINLDRFKDEPEGEWMHYHFYPYDPSDPMHNPATRATSLAHYIKYWAESSQIPKTAVG
jgi:hypothetical protein